MNHLSPTRHHRDDPSQFILIHVALHGSVEAFEPKRRKPDVFRRGRRHRLADGGKLQVNGRIDARWLFDLRNDPTEQVNLATREPARVAALQRLLDAHNAEQAPPAWPSVVEVPINIDKSLITPDAPDDEYIYWVN